MKLFLSFFAFIQVIISFGQDRVIDHTAFNDWKSLSSAQLSRSGEFLTYEIKPHRGDGYLYLVNTKTLQKDSFYRAKSAQFSFESDYLVFTLIPSFDTLRTCELEKIDKKKWPKDSIVVVNLVTKEETKFGNLKSHALGSENNWLTLLSNDNAKSEEKKDKKKKKKKKGKKEEKESKSDGTELTIWNPINKVKHTLKDVTSFELSKSGKSASYITHRDDSSTFNVLNLESSQSLSLSPKFVALKEMTYSKNENWIAFFASNDTVKAKQFTVQLYDFNSNSFKTIVDSTIQDLAKGKSVSENGKLRFSEHETLLYFGIADKLKPEVKDSLLEDEKPKLDVWHYQENRLQPQQLHTLKRDLKKTDPCVFHLKSNRIVVLADDTLNVRIDTESKAPIALAFSNEPYSLAYQWDVSDKEDVYIVDLATGKKELIQKEVRYGIPLSLKADYFVSFDVESKTYHALNIQTRESKCLTCGHDSIIWIGDVNGMPMDAYPEGYFGWNKDGSVLYLKSRNDLFAYDFNTNQLNCVTNYIGRNQGIELSPRKWQNDSSFIDLDNVYFIGFDTKTKGTHVYDFENGQLTKQMYLDESIVEVEKAKESNTLFYRSMTVSNYPEIQLTNTNFESPQKISQTNPNQSEFNWAAVELVNWKSYSGLELEGLLYKPQNFDSTKSYPMIVYYYELYSDKLHNYYSPKPTASIVFPTEYASAGYFIFIPDIRYEEGHPAKSAYDCIMSGTDKMLELYPAIDSTRLGLQGQSWGGYQTAQLITMTTRYRAAMAGAPVSNMFSAYGGIRWGSGMNRQFQYEKTQSRIGKTIWEAPELYVENSPLFHLPKVKTPLLIMHNDGDGAVPWYQGIELFTGMRRLGKPCWLLNYNDDDHNLMKNANRIDLSIRMRQFFDYYLNNQPAPIWLLEGIPAVKKGDELRYDLDKN